MQTLARELDCLIGKRKDEIVDFCCKLVSIPSLVGQEERAQDAVASKLKDMDLIVDLWEPDLTTLSHHPAYGYVETLGQTRPNVAATWKGSDNSGKSLILNGHVDVVSPGDQKQWLHPPFSAFVDDGKIIGRGSCDMKAGVTTNIYAVALLQELGLRPRGNVIIQSVIGEENGGLGTLAAIARGYVADGAIITEPTALNIVAAQTGSLTFRLIIRGRAAHACVRDQGVSAIEKFACLLDMIQMFERTRNRNFCHPLYGNIANKIPINIGVVAAGDWPSTVPDKVIAEGRLGIKIGESISEAKNAFESAVQEFCLRDAWLCNNPIEVEWFEGTFEASETPQDNELVTTLMRCCNATNVATNIVGVTYGSDMRLLINQGRIPTVMFGPGDINVAHAVNEFVRIDELFQAIKVLALFIADWCS